MTEMIELKSYLHLAGNVNTRKYKIHVAIKTPKDHSAVRMVKKSKPIKHNGRDCDYFLIEIDKKNNSQPCGIFFFEDEIDKTLYDHLVVRRVGINGVILPDPDEGAVGNYEDPDGDF